MALGTLSEPTPQGHVLIILSFGVHILPVYGNARWCQITDHSRICTEHTDPLFSRRLHSTCSVRGGDGLAFVLHRDPREADAVGGAGADMGYGGLRNSLAVSSCSTAK